jgi:hypothetical protein
VDAALKAVFIDIDNTLTDPSTLAVPESAALALSLARQNGVLVFAATGRNTLSESERKTIAHITFDGYIAMNGSICHFAGEEPFFSRPLDPLDVAAAFAMHREIGFAMMVNTLYETYVTNVDERVIKFAELVDIEFPELLPKDFNCEKEVIYSLMPYVGREGEARILARLKNGSPARWNDWAFDIIPANGGKHAGMMEMMRRFGLERHEVLAMGDGENDITMLEYAGVGVAMNHALDTVKKSADFIAPVNDAVKSVFEKYGII